MARKTKKDKEIAKLRREVEALRAQLSARQPVSKTASQLVSESVRKEVVKKPQAEPTIVDIRPDLRKTALLTAVSLTILLILHLTQSRWSFIPFH